MSDKLHVLWVGRDPMNYSMIKRLSILTGGDLNAVVPHVATTLRMFTNTLRWYEKDELELIRLAEMYRCTAIASRFGDFMYNDRHIEVASSWKSYDHPPISLLYTAVINMPELTIKPVRTADDEPWGQWFDTKTKQYPAWFDVKNASVVSHPYPFRIYSCRYEYKYYEGTAILDKSLGGRLDKSYTLYVS